MENETPKIICKVILIQLHFPPSHAEQCLDSHRADRERAKMALLTVKGVKR